MKHESFNPTKRYVSKLKEKKLFQFELNPFTQAVQKRRNDIDDIEMFCEALYDEDVRAAYKATQRQYACP